MLHKGTTDDPDNEACSGKGRASMVKRNPRKFGLINNMTKKVGGGTQGKLKWPEAGVSYGCSIFIFSVDCKSSSDIISTILVLVPYWYRTVWYGTVLLPIP